MHKPIIGFRVGGHWTKIVISYKEELADLLLDNVETLAGSEVIIGPWYCAGSDFCHDTVTGMTFGGAKYNFSN